jgi:hypothetical protein
MNDLAVTSLNISWFLNPGFYGSEGIGLGVLNCRACP